ncbi:MAG: hypothetical protein QY311_01100 [Candidatus Paceibacterota bacterium]|nr:MAG: hypothetical protein QY311_01100 [Candidatus Paceibacterota bacterium]
MHSLLGRITSAQIHKAPFPYVVIPNALDPDLCDALLRSFPPLSAITGGEPYVSNQRFSYTAAEALDNASLSREWRDMVSYHVSQSFFGEVLSRFKEHMQAQYPNISGHIGGVDSWRVGMRNKDTFTDRDILLDAQISINTPVVDRASSVKISHIDNERELFAGLLYLRDPRDDSQGGDLEIYRAKRQPRFHGPRLIANRFVEKITSIPYTHNTFVFFLNTPHAIHGVSPRSVTRFPRLLFNVIGEVRDPLFDIRAYRESFLDKIIRHVWH